MLLNYMGGCYGRRQMIVVGDGSLIPTYIHDLFIHRQGNVKNMHTITIDLTPETYKQLAAYAHRVGQAPEVLGRELLETALQVRADARSRIAREVLQAMGCVRALSPTLRRKIMPDVTLDEVRTILAHTAGPSLSDIIQEQRGAKP